MYTTMRERIERKQRRWAKFNGIIDVIGYISAGIAITLLAWTLFGCAYPSSEDPCSPDNEGTDYWYEVCKQGGTE
jgi:hypothetical protein